MFFKNYPNSLFATFLSILATIAFVFGAIGIISFFTGGMKYPSNIVTGAICFVVWFLLRRAADWIAAKKSK